MCRGSQPRRHLLPFLNLGHYKAKRPNTSQPKAQESFCLGPRQNHPRDLVRVLTEKNTVITNRNVTWQHTSPGSPANLPEEAERRFSVDEIEEYATSSEGGGLR